MNSDNPDNVTPIGEGRKFQVANANTPPPWGALDGYSNDIQEFEIAWEVPGGSVEVQVFEGAIVATSVFIGIADEDGYLQFIVPMARLIYVRPANNPIRDQVA